MQKQKQNKNLWNFKSLNLLSNNPITVTQVSKTRGETDISASTMSHSNFLRDFLTVCKSYSISPKLQKFPQFPLAS